MTEHNHELESATYYNKIAKNFNHTWDGFLSGFFKRFIVKNLVISEQAALLDIGCADGTLLAMLHHRTDFHGTGLDISPEMVKIASERHPDFNFFMGTAESLPFPDASFDLITCSVSFHHFPDPERFLDEAARILRPGGRLVIAEIRIPLYDVRKVYNHRITQHSVEGDVKVYGADELLRLFASKGWRVVARKSRLQIQYYELQK